MTVYGKVEETHQRNDMSPLVIGDFIRITRNDEPCELWHKISDIECVFVKDIKESELTEGDYAILTRGDKERRAHIDINSIRGPETYGTGFTCRDIIFAIEDYNQRRRELKKEN